MICNMGFILPTMAVTVCSLVLSHSEKNLKNKEHPTVSNRSYFTNDDVILKDYAKPVHMEIEKHLMPDELTTSERNKKITRDITAENIAVEREKHSVNSTFNLATPTRETPTEVGLSFQDTMNEQIAANEGQFLMYANKPPIYNIANVSMADKIMLGGFKPSIGRIRESYPEIGIAHPTSLTINSSFSYPHGSRTLKHDHSNVDKRMADFQDDLGTLKVKYPELMDLSNDYPIIEEIMIQKVEEKFVQHQHAKNLGKLNFLFEFAKSKPLGDPRSHYPNYAMSYNKPVRQTDMFVSKQPYPFYQPTFHDANDQSAKPTSSSATSAVKPGLSVYTESLLGELIPYSQLKEDNFYYSSVSPKKPSPLKKALNILTAFIPIGLLLSALTPNILNINSTDIITPTKQQQRSIHKSYGATAAGTPNLPELLDTINESRAADGRGVSSECRQRITCEIAIFSQSPGTQRTPSTVFWFFKNISKLLLESKQEDVISQAIRNQNCTALPCDNENIIMSIIALKSTTASNLK